MTALNIATDIPPNIVTLEQLSVWSSRCLANLNSTVVAVEGVNYTQTAAQAGTFYVANTDTTQHIGRMSIGMDPTYLVGGLKPWMYAKEISTKVLTASMKTI